MAAAFQLADVVTSSRSSKTSRLRTCDGADVFYSTANNGLCAPLGPGNFDKTAPAMRVNLEARLDDEDVLAFFDGLDEWAVQYISENAERIFKRPMTPEQVVSGYHPCMRRKDGYAPLLHTKVSTEGPGALRCWDVGGAAREPPSEWMRTRLQLRFHVSHLWIMGTGLGLVVNTTDMQVVSEASDAASERACPF